MAAPNIPNLKSLMTNRPPGRGRGRGGARSGNRFGTSSGFPNDDEAARDRVIQNTDQDAVGSRLSAVNAGYMNDCYAKVFYKGEAAPKRFPIINRGEIWSILMIGTRLNTRRHLCALHGNRSTSKVFPRDQPGPDETDYLSWCWHRLEILPHHRWQSHDSNDISRNRLCCEHKGENRHHQSQRRRSQCHYSSSF